MKVNTKTFSKFLKKVKMSAGQEIQECTFNFEKTGLRIAANSATQQARASGLLKTSAFKGYEELGSIGVGDFPTFVKVVERFGEEIGLKVEGNLLTITGAGKKVDIELLDTQFISTDVKEPELEFADTFMFPADKIKEIIADAKLNKDSVLSFITEEKKLIINNTGKYKFSHQFDVPTCKGGVTVKFGEPFVDAFENLTEKVEFSIKDNYPVKVLEKTDDMVITLIVAPRVDTEA